jgi:hypothetical protein
VFNRLFVGHIDLLIGYALLPFAVQSALRLQGPLWRYGLRVSLWWAALTSLTPHFSWIYGVVVLVVAIVAASKGAIRESALRLAVTVTSFFIMSMYILLPHFATTLATQNGTSSLALYQTSGDPRFGLFGNVAGLYGFWRLGPGPNLPKNLISGWPFLYLAILLVAATGAWVALRRPRPDKRESTPERQRREPRPLPSAHSSSLSHCAHSDEPPGNRAFVATSLLAVGVVGYFLALGQPGSHGAALSLVLPPRALLFHHARTPEIPHVARARLRRVLRMGHRAHLETRHVDQCHSCRNGGARARHFAAARLHADDVQWAERANRSQSRPERVPEGQRD